MSKTGVKESHLKSDSEKYVLKRSYVCHCFKNSCKFGTETEGRSWEV